MKITRSQDTESIKFWILRDFNSTMYVGYLEWKAPKYIPYKLYKNINGRSIGFYISRSNNNDNVTLKFYI